MMRVETRDRRVLALSRRDRADARLPALRGAAAASRRRPTSSRSSDCRGGSSSTPTTSSGATTRRRAPCTPIGTRPRTSAARELSLAASARREPRLPHAARPGRARALLARAARRRRSASDNNRVPPGAGGAGVRDAGAARSAARRPAARPPTRAGGRGGARTSWTRGSPALQRRAGGHATPTWDAANAGRARTLAELKRRLSEIAYLRTLLDDVEDARGCEHA